MSSEMSDSLKNDAKEKLRIEESEVENLEQAKERKNAKENDDKLNLDEKCSSICKKKELVVSNTNTPIEDNHENQQPEDSTTSQKLTLSEACKSGNASLVKSVLHSSQCDVNTAIDGWSCLHDVCMRECQFSEVTKLLLEHGADANATDEVGNTPLHIAIMYHCVENIKLLLQYNADINALNKVGASPIDTAINVKDNDILKLLGQKPVVERTRRRRKQKKEALNVHLPDLSSPPILKKRKLESSPETSQCAKRVKFDSESSDVLHA